MIAATPFPRQPRWQHALQNAVSDPARLLAMLELPSSLIPAATRAARQFALKVPLGYVARMRKGDIDDPLLRQVLPLAAEFEDLPTFVSDPVGDIASIGTPGMLRKYAGPARC
jgi:L-lysine 2,3-aminomutase